MNETINTCFTRRKQNFGFIAGKKRFKNKTPTRKLRNVLI